MTLRALITWPLWLLGMFVGALVQFWKLVLYLLLLGFLLAVVGTAWLLIEAAGVPV